MGAKLPLTWRQTRLSIGLHCGGTSVGLVLLAFREVTHGYTPPLFVHLFLFNADSHAVDGGHWSQWVTATAVAVSKDQVQAHP